MVAVLAVAVMIGGATAAQAAASTRPSIIVNGDTTGIAVQGPDNSLDFYWTAIGTGTWHPEVVAGKNSTYSAPSMILNGANINIADIGEDDSLDCYAAAAVGTQAWDPVIVAGTGSAFSAPSLILSGLNVVQIAVQGSGQQPGGLLAGRPRRL
jgi:hypothetical protein